EVVRLDFFQNSLMRSDFQQIGRFTRLELRWPFSIGIDLYVRDTGQADFNPGLETPEQFRIDLSFDAKGQLLALDRGFYRFGSELSFRGYVRNARSSRPLRRRVQNDTSVGPDRHFSCFEFRKKNGHVHIRKVDDRKHPAAGGQNLTGFGQPIKHSASYRRL